MSSKRCCVPNCLQTRDAHEVLHLFPNPDKEQHRFNSWIYAIGGEVTSLDHSYVYKHRRVCHAHFEDKYCCRNNRISNISVPTLFLPEIVLLISTLHRTDPRVLNLRIREEETLSEKLLPPSDSAAAGLFVVIDKNGKGVYRDSFEIKFSDSNIILFPKDPNLRDT